MFLDMLKKSHSLLGILILFILLLIIIYLVVRYVMKKPFDKSNYIASFIGFLLIQLQVVFGVILYFISPLGLANFSKETMRDATSIVYILQHPIEMLVAAVLIALGYGVIKRKTLSDKKKYSRVLLLYSIAYSFILYATPWFAWT